MKESLRQAIGRKVVSRGSAQELGVLAGVVVEVEPHRIGAVILGRGKKAQLVEWETLSGFGPDALMVKDEAALRPPAGDRERAAVEGKLDLVGKRVLNDTGNELGTIADVFFDPQSGALQTLLIGEREIPAEALLGNGSYAVVVDAAAASRP